MRCLNSATSSRNTDSSVQYSAVFVPQYSLPRVTIKNDNVFGDGCETPLRNSILASGRQRDWRCTPDADTSDCSSGILLVLLGTLHAEEFVESLFIAAPENAMKPLTVVERKKVEPDVAFQAFPASDKPAP